MLIYCVNELKLSFLITLHFDDLKILNGLPMIKVKLL